MLIDHLKQTFSERSEKNPAYSLRAFARSLGIDSSTMSALLKGKRPLSLKLAKRLVENLNIANPEQAQALIMGSFLDSQGQEPQPPEYTHLALEVAEALASWQHFAILALLELNDFKAQDRAIATRLNIPLALAWDSLERLERLGLIKQSKTGWELTGRNMATSTEVPNGALREGHRQNILKAVHSLENDPVDSRDISGMTMAISRKKIPQARKMILEFRRKISAFLEDGKKDAVYRLNIQMFPLSEEKRR